jgi:hypothetical protein
MKEFIVQKSKVGFIGFSKILFAFALTSLVLVNLIAIREMDV